MLMWLFEIAKRRVCGLDELPTEEPYSQRAQEPQPADEEQGAPHGSAVLLLHVELGVGRCAGVSQ